MSKLHELLAVESNLRGQSEAARKDLMNTFEKKRHHFTKVIDTFKSAKEGIPDKVETQLGLQTTVAKELSWISEKIAASIDVSLQVDIANSSARADVVLDSGEILLFEVPATTLLQLEKRLINIQELVASIPTLDPSKGFELDLTEGDAIYRARDTEKPKTEKSFDFIVMVQPTDKFPAQVKELSTDKVIGYTLHQEWCSMITVSQKAEMFDRVEALIRAVKKARSRANDCEIDVNKHRIGADIVKYVFGVK